MEFSRQECWSGLSLTSPGDLPHPGIEPAPPASSALQAESFLLSHWGSPLKSNPIQFKFPQSAAGLKRSSPQESPHARSRKCALWSFQKLENWCHMGGYEIAQAKAWLTLKAGIWNKTEFTFWEKVIRGFMGDRSLESCWKDNVTSLTQPSNNGTSNTLVRNVKQMVMNFLSSLIVWNQYM